MDETSKMDDASKEVLLEGELEKTKTGYSVSLEEKLPPEKKDRFLPISILIAAVLIAGAVMFSALYRPGSAAPTDNGAAAGGAGGTNNTSAMQIGPRDEILGNQNAPVTLVEYGDYQCPFCSAFFAQTQPQLVNDYINKGVVRMVFRNFAFLGPESVAAAQAAECAFDQQKLWPYHDALYQAKVSDEQKGGSENDGIFNRTLFLNLAQKIGLDMPTFTSCLDSNKYASLVAQEKTAAGQVGVNSTPSFFVNGTSIVGAQPYTAFQTAIDAAVKG